MEDGSSKRINDGQDDTACDISALFLCAHAPIQCFRQRLI